MTRISLSAVALHCENAAVFFLLCLGFFLFPLEGASAGLCPAARDLPQVTIHDIEDPAVPVADEWQVFWGKVPLSDAQVALLAGRDPLIEMTRAEMAMRGTWVYVGMGTSGVGTAASCIGWVLYGRRDLSPSVTLPLAVGGLLVGIFGFLMVTEAIQTPLEPHLAPTPVHRLSRAEARMLVAEVNRRLYRDICRAAGVRSSVHQEERNP